MAFSIKQQFLVLWKLFQATCFLCVWPAFQYYVYFHWQYYKSRDWMETRMIRLVVTKFIIETCSSSAKPQSWLKVSEQRCSELTRTVNLLLLFTACSLKSVAQIILCGMVTAVRQLGRHLNVPRAVWGHPVHWQPRRIDTQQASRGCPWKDSKFGAKTSLTEDGCRGL